MVLMRTDEQPPPDAVFTAELAARMGVKPGTVKHYVSQAGKGWPRGRNRLGFPPPDGRSLMEVASPSTPAQPTRRAWVPWWERATVDAFLSAWRPERRRDAAGRWIPGD
jgi:hypothetical protein